MGEGGGLARFLILLFFRRFDPTFANEQISPKLMESTIFITTKHRRKNEKFMHNQIEQKLRTYRFGFRLEIVSKLERKRREKNKLKWKAK